MGLQIIHISMIFSHVSIGLLIASCQKDGDTEMCSEEAPGYFGVLFP